ncbi:MAG: hypothetical protein ACRDVG_03500 [Jatrophihabitantaceae bacterium]
MSDTTQAVLLGILTLATSVWVGGYVAIAVVARVANRTLEPANRVAFFRALGRSYLFVGAPALLVAIGAGAWLATDRSWDDELAASVALAAALLVSLGVGVKQARRMTRLRAAALADPSDLRLTRRVQHGARTATVLRAVIGLLSLALIALGSLLAT